MRRREVLSLLSGAGVSWPLAVRAQQQAMPVIGFLHPGSLAMNSHIVAAFSQGLAEAGYVEGRNVAIEFRWANNQLGQLPALAADLVGLRTAVIVAAGALGTALAAKNAIRRSRSSLRAASIRSSEASLQASTGQGET